MTQLLSTPGTRVAGTRPASGLRSLVVWGGAGLGALLVVAALALWFHYGTVVFFDTIAAGFAGCF